MLTPDRDRPRRAVRRARRRARRRRRRRRTACPSSCRTATPARWSRWLGGRPAESPPLHRSASNVAATQGSEQEAPGRVAVHGGDPSVAPCRCPRPASPAATRPAATAPARCRRASTTHVPRRIRFSQSGPGELDDPQHRDRPSTIQRRWPSDHVGVVATARDALRRRRHGGRVGAHGPQRRSLATMRAVECGSWSR